MKKTLLAGAIGNVLEWYDFALYGYFAPVFAVLFFPSADPSLSLIAAFGVFAVGFLARPLGAMLFGYWGDTLGRRNALAWSILLMAIPTCLVGLLPTYDPIPSYRLHFVKGGRIFRTVQSGRLWDPKLFGGLQRKRLHLAPVGSQGKRDHTDRVLAPFPRLVAREKLDADARLRTL
jgi:MFS family permease